MRDDDLSLLQKLVGPSDAFAQQAPGILTEVENQAMNVAKLIQSFAYFMVRGLLEAGYVNVPYARADQKMDVNAVAGNLIAHHREIERLVRAFPQHGDLDRSALGPLQQLGHI